MADEKTEKPLGGVRIKVHSFNDGKVSGVGVNGRSYTPDAKGFIYVRPEDIAACLDHGHEGAWE